MLVALWGAAGRVAKEARAAAVAQGGGQQWGSSLAPPPSRGGKRNLREGASRDPLAPCAVGSVSTLTGLSGMGMPAVMGRDHETNGRKWDWCKSGSTETAPGD